MIRIVYDAELGHALPDGKVRAFVDQLAKENNEAADLTAESVWCIGTEQIIDHIRLAIKDGKISHEQVIFEYKGEEIRSDKDGRLPYWPKGFCEITSQVLMNLCRGR
jgi:ferredoxin-NADP reductase